MHKFIFQDIYKWAGKILSDFSNVNWQSKNIEKLSKNFAKRVAENAPLLWNNVLCRKRFA